MNPLQGTSPTRGLTREECDELLRDLAAGTGIQVLRVKEPSPGIFRLYCHCDVPNHTFWITNAALFRETVRAGFIEWIPKNALDGGTGGRGGNPT